MKTVDVIIFSQQGIVRKIKTFSKEISATAFYKKLAEEHAPSVEVDYFYMDDMKRAEAIRKVDEALEGSGKSIQWLEASLE